jgi:hypothetical protein
MAHPVAIFTRLERLRQFLVNFLKAKWSLRRSNEHLVKPLHIRSLAKVIQLQSTSRVFMSRNNHNHTNTMKKRMDICRIENSPGTTYSKSRTFIRNKTISSSNDKRGSFRVPLLLLRQSPMIRWVFYTLLLQDEAKKCVHFCDF